jgi:hypothetical protein
MSQSTISSEVNKGICEALGCFAKATKEVEVQVGKQGKIILRLCGSCIAKFQDD